MVWAFWPETDTRHVVQPKPSLLGLLLWNIKPFASPDPLDQCPAVVCSQTTTGALWFTYQPALFSNPVIIR